jgi:hypothetical protein
MHTFTQCRGASKNRLEAAMTDRDIKEPSMPADATRDLFLWASGFAIGALLILGAFIFLVGIGTLGHNPSNPPAAQSAAHAPATPAPQTSNRQQTTGQESQPTQPETTGQAPKPEPGKAPALPVAPSDVPKPGANRS